MNNTFHPILWGLGAFICLALAVTLRDMSSPVDALALPALATALAFEFRLIKALQGRPKPLSPGGSRISRTR
jgi:hypothetical protein